MTRPVAWVQIAWTEPLFWRWFFVRMAMSTVPALLCFHWRAGLLGLGALALAAFPWPVRITLDSRGITLTSFLVRVRWAADTLERVALEVDTRPHAWPRRPVLVIERRDRPVARVFGSAARLAELAHAASALGFT